MISRKKGKEFWKSFTWKTVVYLLLIVIAFFMVLPFYWSFVSSVRPNSESILDVSFWPKEWTWEHYQNIFIDIPLAQYFLNTAIITAMGMFTNLFFCSLAGYALAKFRFPGRNIILNIFLISMMIPGIVFLVPQYIVTAKLGFVDTFWGVVLPGAIGVYGILFIRQFFLSIPNDFAESARLDGAGELRIFVQIYFRMVIPGLITLGIFTFNSYWNSFLWPNIVLMDESKAVLSVALKNYQIFYSDNMGPLMACSILMGIPVFIVYIVGQKYFVNNMSFSGIKG